MGQLDPLGDLFDAHLLFGDKDGVGAGRHAGVEGNPANVAAHHFRNHAAVVGFTRGAQAVDRLRGDFHGSVETKGVVRRVEIVIHGLRDADDLQTGVSEAFGCCQGALAADRDDGIDAQPFHVGLDDLRTAAVLEGVGAGSAQDGAALLGDTADHGAGDVNDVTFHHTTPAVPEAHELLAVDCDAFEDRSTDHCVEAGAVAAAGKNANFHVCSLMAWRNTCRAPR